MMFVQKMARAGTLGLILHSLPSAAAGSDLLSLAGESGEATREFREPPFKGEWAPEENLDACAPIREGYAEGDFVSIRGGRLITGAEFGCEIVDMEEQSRDIFRLTLECGGPNRHFAGKRSARIVMESADRLLMQFDGGDPARFVRCR